MRMTQDPTPSPPRPRRKLYAAAAALLLGLAGAGVVGWLWSRTHPTSDDAYVQADVLPVAAQVSGPVRTVAVRDQQHVRAGDLLFTIDPAPFRLSVRRAEAQLTLAGQGAGVDVSGVLAAQSQLADATAAVDDARLTFERARYLAQRGIDAPAALDQARATYAEAEANAQAARANVVAARQKLGKPGDANAAVRAAAAGLALAQLDLAHSEVRAPADGWVAGVTLTSGAYVPAGATLFELVRDGTWRIEANFKETDLARIRPGQPATVRLDMYPGAPLAAHVSSIGPGSGVAFSVLPPENATGNWVKVTQRFPVRLGLDDPPSVRRPLRVGASADVTIDTGSRP
jgi:membrane fusion protein (multidrug efflux system)